MNNLLKRYASFVLMILAYSICSAQNSGTGKDGVIKNGNSYVIIQEEPGTILDYLPVMELKEIDSLTVIGLMDERDFKYINHMSNLRYIDLSSTYITYEPEKRKSIKAENDAIAALASYFDEAIEAKKKSGEIDDLRYLSDKYLIDLMKQSTSVNIKTDPCFMPAIMRLEKLETVKMPQLATWLANGSFYDCIALKNVEWSENIREFNNCFINTALEKVTFPKELRRIDLSTWGGSKKPFDGCKKLTALDFSKCYNLEQINLTQLVEGIPNLRLVWFSPNWTGNVRIPWREKIQYVIPEKVKKIEVSSNTNPVVIRFLSPMPPDELHTRVHVTAYIPKGSLNAYYAAIGLDNENIEFREF